MGQISSHDAEVMSHLEDDKVNFLISCPATGQLCICWEMRVLLVFVFQMLLGHSDKDQQSGNNAVKWYSSAVNNSMWGKVASFKATQKGLMWDIFIWSLSISHSWEPLSTAPCIAHPQWLQECQQSPVYQMIQCHNSPQVCCTVFYSVDLSFNFLQTD